MYLNEHFNWENHDLWSTFLATPKAFAWTLTGVQLVKRLSIKVNNEDPVQHIKLPIDTG